MSITDLEAPANGGEDNLKAGGPSPVPTKAPAPKKRNFGARVFAFLSSFLLAATILFFFFLTVLAGTIQQIYSPLYEVQRDYFESLYVLHPLINDEETGGSFLIPLPGGYLLMAMLFVNLLCGAIIRARKSWRRPGMVIAHSSILIFIAAGAVSLYFKDEGHLALYHGESGNVAQTFRDWEIKVLEVDDKGEAKDAKYMGIPKEHFTDLEPGQTRLFHSSKLPFDLEVHSYYPNTMVQPISIDTKAPKRDRVGRFYLSQEKETNQESMPGMTVRLLRPKEDDKEDDKEIHKAILWSLTPYHEVVEVDGRKFAIILGRRRFELPYTVQLDKFEAEFHPGTVNAKEFSSDVTKFENNREETSTISMNKPLRSNGYTVYQTNWGPQPQGGPSTIDPNERYYSTFEVSTNPSDQWPLYACIVVSIGLCIHFCQMLYAYLKRNRKRLERERATSPSTS